MAIKAMPRVCTFSQYRARKGKSNLIYVNTTFDLKFTTFAYNKHTRSLDQDGEQQ